MDLQQYLIHWALGLLCLLQFVLGQDSGDMSLGCESLGQVDSAPGVGPPAQVDQETTPFHLTAADGTAYSYSPGGKIKVMFRGNFNVSSIAIQALHSPATDTGSWSRDTSGSQPLTCAVDSDSLSLALSSPVNKHTFTYNLKSQIADGISIYFTAAAVDKDGKVWSNITSAAWAKQKLPATTVTPDPSTETTILGISQVTFTYLLIGTSYVGMYFVFSFLLI